MATLNWIGKDAVANHDKDVPFKLLEKVPGASVGKESKNLIVHGDNLEALKALMPFYKGKVKCVYIDPPYNTGNESWVYNDKVNSPKIREWIKKVVGREGEDLTRHDKWLCMMYPRLKLLKDLMTDDGAIFVSIDDNEQHHLRLLMDEIFGESNFVTNIIWQKKYTQSNDARYFSDTHDFLVVYAKQLENFKLHKLIRTEEQNARYLNPDNDKRGPWMSQPLHAKSGSDKTYSHTFTNGVRWEPPNGTYPRYTKATLEKAEQEGRMWFGTNGTAVPRMKKYLNEMTEGVVPRTLWLYTEVGSNDDAKRDIKALFNANPFESPKPVSLVRRVIELCADENSIILDSFAGSGTTGHSVLELNKEDGGKRQFILVEMEDDIAKRVTAERVKRAIKKNGYDDGFEYCELKKPLFDAVGMINEQCSYEELAAYIYFTETQMNIDKKKVVAPFIGLTADKSYYLLYAGKGKNDLTRAALAKMKIQGSAVVYADRCLVDEQDLEEYLKGVDLVIDGIDAFEIEARRKFFNTALSMYIPVITAGPIGFSTAFLIFMPGGPNFDQYFNVTETTPYLQKLISFLVGLTPALLQRTYMKKVSLKEKRGPSSAGAVALCAGIVTIYALKIFLNKGPIKAVPYYHQFDVMRDQYVVKRISGGNRNLIQKLKMRMLERMMPD